MMVRRIQMIQCWVVLDMEGRDNECEEWLLAINLGIWMDRELFTEIMNTDT